MENITSDIYYYNEELKQKRPKFEIHPNLPKGINIEEPASTASEEQFLWRLYWGDVANGDRKFFSQPPTMTWTDANGEKQVFSSAVPTPIPEDVIFPVEINMIVNFEIHMRYQPVGPGLEYRDIEFGGDTRMRMMCEPNDRVHHPMISHAEKPGQKDMVKTDHLENITTEGFTVRMPTGDSDKLEAV